MMLLFLIIKFYRHFFIYNRFFSPFQQEKSQLYSFNKQNIRCVFNWHFKTLTENGEIVSPERVKGFEFSSWLVTLSSNCCVGLRVSEFTSLAEVKEARIGNPHAYFYQTSYIICFRVIAFHYNCFF